MGLLMSDGFYCFFFFAFVVLAAADRFIGFAVFFEAFFVAAVTAVAITVTFEGDLEVFLEDSVQNRSDGSDADDGTDDGENGLERAALLIFHNNTSVYPPRGMMTWMTVPARFGRPVLEGDRTELQDKYIIKTGKLQ